MKRQSNNGLTTKMLIRVCPVLIVIFFISYVEWQAWKANSKRQLILSTPRDAICEPHDLVCRQCPFFREKVQKMNECVRKVLDEQIASEDVGLVFNSIPFSVQKCNLKWTMTQRIIQMTKVGNTQFVLTPSNPRSSLTALVVGVDDNFEMERQLKENMTRTHFYGTNFNDVETVKLFKSRLNGTQLHKQLNVGNNVKSAKKEKETTALTPRIFFQKYFTRRPLDIVFIHSNNTAQEFVDQLMGKGSNGVQHPVCQLNIEISLPSKLGSARQLVQWFKQLNTKMNLLQRQYLIGYATIVVDMDNVMRLRFYAINVGQIKCVAKFLNQSECRTLIGSEFDE